MWCDRIRVVTSSMASGEGEEFFDVAFVEAIIESSEVREIKSSGRSRT
jgi:hypothetical protein